MSSDDHLSWRDAIRFWWHSLRHARHADEVFYDHRRETVRCGACGREWGKR